SAADNEDVHSALLFGGGASGEGIVSDRVGTSAHPNLDGLDFLTNSKQRLSITQAGNVGIGTTSPIAPLNASFASNELLVGTDSSAGNMALEPTNTNHGTGNSGKSNAAGLGFDGGSGIRQAIVGGTFSLDFLDFYIGGNLTTPKVHIDSNGN